MVVFASRLAAPLVRLDHICGSLHVWWSRKSSSEVRLISSALYVRSTLFLPDTQLTTSRSVWRSHAAVLFSSLRWLMEQHEAFLWLMGANESLEGQRAALRRCCRCCFHSTTATTNSLECLWLRDPFICITSCFSVSNEAALCLRSTCCSHVSWTAAQVAGTIPKVNVRLYKKTGWQQMVWITTFRW